MSEDADDDLVEVVTPTTHQVPPPAARDTSAPTATPPTWPKRTPYPESYGRIRETNWVKYGDKIEDLKGMFWQKLMGTPAYGDTTVVESYKIVTDLRHGTEDGFDLAPYASPFPMSTHDHYVSATPSRSPAQDRSHSPEADHPSQDTIPELLMIRPLETTRVTLPEGYAPQADSANLSTRSALLKANPRLDVTLDFYE
jgi:hypothetical protein